MMADFVVDQSDPYLAHVRSKSQEELAEELKRRDVVIRQLETARRDWPRGSTAEAVDRVRDAAEQGGDGDVTVAAADLRKLFSSADGVAESYSTVLSEICGLSKPSTDPKIALDLAREQERVWTDACIEEALEPWKECVEKAKALADAERDVMVKGDRLRREVISEGEFDEAAERLICALQEFSDSIPE